MVRDQGLSVSEVCGRWSWVRRPFGGGSRLRFHPDVRTSAPPSQRTFARRSCPSRPRPKGDSGRVALRDHCRFQSGPQRYRRAGASAFNVCDRQLSIGGGSKPKIVRLFRFVRLGAVSNGVSASTQTHRSRRLQPRRLVVTDQKIDGHRLLYL